MKRTGFWCGFMAGLVLVSCAGLALDIAIFKGNHEKLRIEREVKVDGKRQLEVVYAGNRKFDQFRCIHRSDFSKINDFYNRCRNKCE